MKKILFLIMALCFAASANAAVLIESSNGIIDPKVDLPTASTAADTLGKKIIVTSPVTLTTAVTITGRQFECRGQGVVLLSGSGALTFGSGSVTVVRPEWFGLATSSPTTTSTAQSALNKKAILNAIASLAGRSGYYGKTGGTVQFPIGD